MEIRAKVSQRIIKKADHFFTGSVGGRITELMQNSRRAGSQSVVVTQELQKRPDTGTYCYAHEKFEGIVTVADNGEGIQNWEAVLHLGESDWHPDIESSEEPAGIGLFSLAPRPVTIRSQGKVVCIEGNGWFGDAVEVREDTSDRRVEKGTSLTFQDSSWAEFKNGSSGCRNGDVPVEPMDEMRTAAAFGDMGITFNGKELVRKPFLHRRWEAVHYPKLGVEILVLPYDDLPKFHDDVIRGNLGALNFHGQLVTDCIDDLRVVESPGGFRGRRYGGFYVGYDKDYVLLINMTGEPTSLALMLPARTKLVKGPAFDRLKAACEYEELRFYSKRSHNLPYGVYERAHELGIEDFPESKPLFGSAPSVTDNGNVEAWDGGPDFITHLSDDLILLPQVDDVNVYLHEPPEEGRECGVVTETEDISHGNYFDESDWKDAQFVSFLMGSSEENQKWFVTVPSGYEAYSWAKCDRIADCIAIIPGPVVTSGSLNSDTIYVVESITIRVGLTNGEVHDADVDACFADNGDLYMTEHGLQQWDFQKHALWMTGGYDEDEPMGAEEKRTEEEFQNILDGLIGENESLRRCVVEGAREHTPYGWSGCTIIVTPRDTVVLKSADKKLIMKTNGSSKEKI